MTGKSKPVGLKSEKIRADWLWGVQGGAPWLALLPRGGLTLCSLGSFCDIAVEAEVLSELSK